MSFAACSEIAEEERFVEIPLPDVNRNVLIEDFTGQSCTNCPEATKIIHELQELYGSDAVVAVGIYSGPFGKPKGSTSVNLVTDLGQQYWDHWFTSSTGQPIGMVNRQILEREQWKQAVAEALAKPTQMAISSDVEYFGYKREVKVSVNAFDPMHKEGTLYVWLTEDNIEAFQMVGSTPKKDYIHNHVFRAAMNGDWGETVELGSLDTKFNNEYRYTLDESWKEDDIHVVIFIATEDGVEQVVTHALNEPLY